MSSLVALFKVSWYGVKIWFTIYKGYGSVMSIKDLIKELDSNLIVDDIEKKENCIYINCHKPVNE